MKTFKLFKRGPDGKPMSPDADGYRERPFYFNFMLRGERYMLTTETPDAAEALKRARAKFNAIKTATITGELDKIDEVKTRHVKVKTFTLDELCEAYHTSPVRAKKSSRKHNVKCMFNLLRQVHPGMTNETLGKTPFPEIVNAASGENWFKVPNKATTANSVFKAAASLCAPRARFTYQKLKMDHDCLGDFAKVGKMCFKPAGKLPPPAPSDDIIKRTLAAWETCEDRNVFLAIGHELAFGLRAGEVKQAKWSWWETKYGCPMICAKGEFKDNPSNYIEQPALDPFWTIMTTKAHARGWVGKPDDDIIIGTPTDREEFKREVSALLRGLGWKTQKTNHALRAYAGGLVALKYGIYKASQFLRHSSVKVTEQHYMYLLKHPLIDSIREKCPAKWATETKPEPKLTVVEKAA